MQPLREGLVQSSHHLFSFVNEENVYIIIENAVA
jgi:hypothetical protein